MSLANDADQLARELFDTKSRLRAAGRALHDQVGPLLSATGIRIGLLRSEHPGAASEAGRALEALQEAMESVRSLSRALNPPPAAYLGLKKALSTLVETEAETFPGIIHFSYTASAALADEAAPAVFETASALLKSATADPAATRISVSAAGARNVIVRIASNGRGAWPRAFLAALARRARPAGIVLDTLTKKGTIVSIRYAARRSARG